MRIGSSRSCDRAGAGWNSFGGRRHDAGAGRRGPLSSVARRSQLDDSLGGGGGAGDPEEGKTQREEGRREDQQQNSGGESVARNLSAEEQEAEDQRALDELKHEFHNIIKSKFDGLELEANETSDLFRSTDEDVTIWLEKDRPARPKVEAKELFDWWHELDDVFVLIFQLNDGEEDGIFTLKDSSEASASDSEEDAGNSNFILAFESSQEAVNYANKLSDSLQGLDAEVECMGRDELLQLCKELEVGIRIVQEGGEEPDIPSYVQTESSEDFSCDISASVDEYGMGESGKSPELWNELDDLRRSLEGLLPDDDDDIEE